MHKGRVELLIGLGEKKGRNRLECNIKVLFAWQKQEIHEKLRRLRQESGKN